MKSSRKQTLFWPSSSFKVRINPLRALLNEPTKSHLISSSDGLLSANRARICYYNFKLGTFSKKGKAKWGALLLILFDDPKTFFVARYCPPPPPPSRMPQKQLLLNIIYKGWLDGGWDFLADSSNNFNYYAKSFVVGGKLNKSLISIGWA